MKHFKLQYIMGLVALTLLSGCVVDPYAVYGNPQERSSSMGAMSVNNGSPAYPSSQTYYPYSVSGYNANYPVNTYSAYNVAPLNAYSVPAYHIVQEGDSLYKISRRYGLNYRYIASRNGIYPPYTIWPGQRLLIQ